MPEPRAVEHPGEAQHLCASAELAERVLVDPQQAAARDGQPHAINYYSASPDGSPSVTAWRASRPDSASSSADAVITSRSRLGLITPSSIVGMTPLPSNTNEPPS